MEHPITDQIVAPVEYVTCVLRRVVLSHEENVPDMDPVGISAIQTKLVR
jgi:hypothetical protein